jgi:exodeoxyribonuclease VII small subunit
MQTFARIQTLRLRRQEQVTTSRKRTPDLEKSLADLENIVQQLEAGDLSLEDALKQFEKGVKLTRDCQTALQAAEQRVKVLLEGSIKDFAEDSAEED